GRARDSPGDLPLRGVRVVDLTAMWAGPYATRLLLDLGATIWKVEGPRRPDGIRGRGAAAAPFFHELNHGKLNLALDLATEAGRADLLRLVARADLVIENFSPRVMGNLGLASAIRRVNRDVVTVSMPAFGRSGPYRDYVGYGATLEALAGLVVQGGAGGEPRLPAVAVSDALSGVLGAAVSVAGLYRRAAGHGGADVELSQWEALLQAIGDELLDAARTSLRHAPAPPAPRRRAPARGPLAGIFACEHGRSWVAIACGTPQQTRLLDRIAAADEASSGAAGSLPPPRRGSGAARLDAWLARHSAEAVAARLAAVGIPAAPVRDVAAICADPLLEARGFWAAVEDETGRRFRVPGPPWRIADAPPRRGTDGARPLGADTARVLSERDDGR
ncbi:MAG TPA: CoA transferase, partial [Thermodesulfobacteriota bacterium]